MLVAPTSTGTYFAWPLGPPGLAALVGGFYVVSAPVFGYAGTRPVVEVRGLAAAVLAFTVPTLVATYLHRDIFDFSRLMAMAWVVLFIASPITFALLLWSGRMLNHCRATLASTALYASFSSYWPSRSSA
jgi:hypothetical protein